MSAPLVGVIGHFNAELGVGEAGRLLTAGLEAAGARLITETLTWSGSRQAHPFDAKPGDLSSARILVVCDNADGLQRVVAERGVEFFTRRYTIGLWFWEVNRFPAEMRRGFEFVDEVWTASEYVRDAIGDGAPKPVRRVPLPLPIYEATTVPDRAARPFPDEFLFVFCFDFTSVIGRKNPFGLIEAFCRAFPRDAHAALLIKSVNGVHFPEELARLTEAASRHPRVRIQDGFLAPDERLALMASADGYVSLHRSEGLGLTMAEAMGVGTPVIATGFSGNLTFMGPDNAFLVDYELIPVGAGSAPYPADATWADPDLDHAARLMRSLAADAGAARELGARGRSSLERDHSAASCAAALALQLRDVSDRARKRRRRVWGPRTPRLRR